MRENNSMKHIGKTITLPAVAAILLLAGCSREFKVDNGANFKTTSFDKFLWHKHVPDTVKAIITTEFAECEDLSDPLVLQLCNDDGKAVGEGQGKNKAQAQIAAAKAAYIKLKYKGDTL